MNTPHLLRRVGFRNKPSVESIMSFRTTAILLALVILAVAGLLVYDGLKDDTPTDGGLIASFANGIKESDVDTVELTRTEPTEEKLVFVRTGPAAWELRQPTTARVDSFAIDSLIKSLWNAKPVKYPGLTQNLTTHGLAKPNFTVTLKSRGERSVTANFGDTTIGGADAVTFLTTADRPGVPLAFRASDLRAFFRDGQVARDGPASPKAKWLGDYRSKRLWNVDSTNPGSDLATIQLARGTETIRLVHTPERNWKFERPANFGEADTLGDPNPKTEFFTGVRPLLNLLINLQASSPDDFIENVPASDWPKYGLTPNDPTTIRVELKPKGDAPAEVVFLGKPVEGATPTRIYCRRENDPGVVKVPTDRLPAILGTLQNPGELRNRDFLAESRKDLIDAIDLSVKGENFRLRRIGNGPTAVWKVYGGAEPRDGNNAAVQAIIEALTKPRAAAAILPAPNPNAFNAPEIQGELKVWFAGLGKVATPPDSTDKAEPTLKGNADASFVIGRVDADGSFFKRTMNGVTTEYKIAPELIAALAKRRLDFVAVKSEVFSPFAANALTLVRGKDIIEVKKTSVADDPNMRWSFVQPAANKDQNADSQTIAKLLEALGTYRPFKVISDSATPEELKKWGLDAATARATVTVSLAGIEKPQEYILGSESDDKASLYVKLADQPFVTLAPKALYDEIANADFRDKVIFRTDPNKVSKIVLSGWKTMTTPAKQVILELNAGKWVSNSPEFVPDDAKVKVFLGELRSPRLIEFVKDVKPAEMGLTAEHGSLQIFLYQRGVAEPVWIDLGSKEESGKPALFATSSGVKNSVFKIDGTYFKQFVSDPRALQK